MIKFSLKKVWLFSELKVHVDPGFFLWLSWQVLIVFLISIVFPPDVFLISFSQLIVFIEAFFLFQPFSEFYLIFSLALTFLMALSFQGTFRVRELINHHNPSFNEGKYIFLELLNGHIFLQRCIYFKHNHWALWLESYQIDDFIYFRKCCFSWLFREDLSHGYWKAWQISSLLYDYFGWAYLASTCDYFASCLNYKFCINNK